MNDYIFVDGEPRARVWTYKERAVFAFSEEEARDLAERKARRDIPDLTQFEIIRVTRTPTGRYTLTIRITR